MTTSLFCWHAWGRWSNPKNGILQNSEQSVGYFAVCQLRICDKCGKAEVRRLPNIRKINDLKGAS